jgi:hypothetical protein
LEMELKTALLLKELSSRFRTGISTEEHFRGSLIASSTSERNFLDDELFRRSIAPARPRLSTVISSVSTWFASASMPFVTAN